VDATPAASALLFQCDEAEVSDAGTLARSSISRVPKAVDDLVVPLSVDIDALAAEAAAAASESVSSVRKEIAPAKSASQIASGFIVMFLLLMSL
jgi:hypothetical protein